MLDEKAKAFLNDVAYLATVDDVSMDTKYKDLGTDSIDDIELIMFIEDENGLVVDDKIVSSIVEFNTVGDIYEFVKYAISSGSKYVTNKTINDFLKQKEKKMKNVLPTTRNHNKRWTETDRSSLIKSYASGTPIKYIAENLGRTEVAVLGQLDNLGLVKFNRSENAYFTVPTMLYKF